MVAKHPDRLMGMGTVPLQDPGMAVAELDRTVKELGFRGVELCTNVRGVDLTRAGLEKFFARVEELDVMIFLHPFGTSLVGRMEDHYFPNTSDIRWIPRCASGNWCSTAISNAFPN